MLSLELNPYRGHSHTSQASLLPERELYRASSYPYKLNATAVLYSTFKIVPFREGPDTSQNDGAYLTKQRWASDLPVIYSVMN